jgi:NAD(P)-dependent dehydrogenase (short-subunit alcohol dehydrogenase family)
MALLQGKRVALVTGANQGVGRQVAKELVANGLTVLVGSRNLERGEAAAREIGPGAIPLQLDVTDQVFDRRGCGTYPQGFWAPRRAH